MKNKMITDNKYFSATLVYDNKEWSFLPSINLFIDDNNYKLLTFGFLCFGIGIVF